MVIFTKHIDWLKPLIVNILAYEKSMTTLLSQTFKVLESKVPLLYSFLASMQSYWRFVLLTSLHIWLK